MTPPVFLLALRDCPACWQRIASELSDFCGVGCEEDWSFFALWQVICRDMPKRLTGVTFPPGSAILERITESTDEEIVDALMVVAGCSYEGLEGKTVLAILKKHCAKPAKQKRVTGADRWDAVWAQRRRNR